ncbi:co-chaperone YbbN [Oceanispirochaeta sp.]|uniref:thioredoxin family protein n=1 Tax=Oceanispirochaeta sp. TaxID=2035350 RepID=UPI002621E9D2|nr:thioredoxin family protein [Oceanispirochaeta sp.]MDA3958893.1 thioredoxin family protein [Oceanispirochaeta sp.]
MIELTELKEIQDLMSSEGFHLFYLSRPACGVCSVVKAKVIEMLQSFPEIKSYYINLDLVPEAAGQFSIFTIPGILLYAEGKEIIREARYLSISDLERQISRPYELAFN